MLNPSNGSKQSTVPECAVLVLDGVVGEGLEVGQRTLGAAWRGGAEVHGDQVSAVTKRAYVSARATCYPIRSERDNRGAWNAGHQRRRCPGPEQRQGWRPHAVSNGTYVAPLTDTGTSAPAGRAPVLTSILNVPACFALPCHTCVKGTPGPSLNPFGPPSTHLTPGSPLPLPLPLPLACSCSCVVSRAARQCVPSCHTTQSISGPGRVGGCGASRHVGMRYGHRVEHGNVPNQQRVMMGAHRHNGRACLPSSRTATAPASTPPECQCAAALTWVLVALGQVLGALSTGRLHTAA